MAIRWSFVERSPIWNIQNNKKASLFFFTDPHFTENFMLSRFANFGSQGFELKYRDSGNTIHFW